MDEPHAQTPPARPHLVDSSRPPGGFSPRNEDPPRIPDHELLRVIGRGSYGEVWLARNIMGTYRAVKVVYRSTFESDKPYEREFQGIKRFEPVSRSHESQLDILHVGRGEDCFYYIMELGDDQARGQEIDPENYLPKTLRNQLNVRGRIPAGECVELALGLATALEHLHSRGLVHRDVKPSNIVFVHDVPKLADIGLVAQVDATISFVGTEGYLPPEGPGTAQADIYSLGKVLYEMATGRDRQDFPELPTHMESAPDRVELLELNEIILRACQRDIRERYRTAAEMQRDLVLLQSGRSIRQVVSMERRMKQLSRIGFVALLLTILASGAFLLQRHQTAEANRLARENKALAEKSRELLLRMQVGNGNKYVTEGDYGNALVWFKEALQTMEGYPVREEAHRIRLDSLLRNYPRVVQIFQHDAGVLFCEFSPDGKFMVSASKDHTARVWDVATGQPVCPPLQHEDEVYLARFSPNGKWVLTVSDDLTARVWDAMTGQPVSPPIKHENIISSASFCPAGKTVLTATIRGPAIIRDAITGDAVGPAMQGEGGMNSAVFRARFSPDGSRVVTADAGATFTVWDVASGQPLFPPVQAGGILNFAIFSPDGEKILTGSGDRRHASSAMARVWNAANGEPLTPPMNHDSAVIRGSFSPDGERVVTAQEQSRETSVARVWDIKTGVQIGPDLRHGAMRSARFCPDGWRVVTAGGENGTALVWDASTGYPLTPPLPHATWVYNAEVSPDGYFLATASEDNLVRIWNLVTEDGPYKAFNHANDQRTKPWAFDCAFGPDGSKFLVGAPGEASLYETDSGNKIQSVSNRTPGLVTFSPNARQFLATSGKNFRSMGNDPWDLVAVFETTTGKLLFNIPHQEVITHAEFSSDGHYLLTSSREGLARVWSATNGEPAGPPLQHFKEVNHASFSPDGVHVVTASEDHTAQIWSWKTGEKIGSTLRHNGPVNFATYSPDGRQIATASRDQTIRIWDSLTGNPITSPMFQAGIVTGASFHPDGHSIASWSVNPKVRVWNTSNGERLLPPLEHRNVNRWVEFSPDGRFIVSASSDNSARLWDVATGEAISVPLMHEGQVLKAVFHPSEPRILTASEGGGARIWSFATFKWPAEDVMLLVRLLAAHELDQTLSISSLNADQMVSAFQFLQSKYPEEFLPDHEKRVAWHHNHAVKAELTESWASAAWHLSRLISSDPDQSEFYFRRGQAWARLNKLDLALEDFSKVQAVQLTLDQKVAKFRHLAIALIGQARFAEAESLFKGDSLALYRTHARWLINQEDWTGAEALWHDKVLELTRAAIPPRSPTLDSRHIDLSAFFNGGLDRNWHFDANVLNDLSLLPTGLQNLAGVAFDIRGLIQLGRRAEGLRGNEHLGLFPSQVTGIPMDLECRQLHFLHSAVWAEDPKGTRIGTYRLNFEDGERVELPIVLGEELLDWHKPFRPVETEGSLTVAWEGVNGSGITVRLFKTSWQNPRPEVRILSLDFVGHETQGAPFLVAITAE